MEPARRSTPPIPGLYVFPGLLPEDVQGEILGEIARAGIFKGGKRDQVMFFPSTSSTSTSACSSSTSGISTSASRTSASGISASSPTSTTTPTPAWTNQEKTIENKTDSNPEFLTKTLRIVEDLLRPRIPEDVLRLLFDDHHHHLLHHHNPHPPRRQRQSIINLYPLPLPHSLSLSDSSPYNNGITPHVDLPNRYGDGIVGVCLGSGVALGFEEVCLGGDYGEGKDGDGGLWGEEGGLWGETEEEEEEEEEEEGDEGDDEGGRQGEEGENAESDTPNDADDRNSAEPSLKRKKIQSSPSPSNSSESTESNSTTQQKKKQNNKKNNNNKKRKKRPTSYEVYLPKGTIYILSGEARWSWMHGIEARGEDLVWDDDGSDDEEEGEGEGEGENEGEGDGERDGECDDGESGGVGDSTTEGCGEDGDGPERRQMGKLQETLGSEPSLENSRKRKRTPTATRSKRTRPRTATRILRDTRVSITYRWLKPQPQPRHGTDRPRDDGDENEEADEGFGGILLQDPVGEGDDWNVR